MKITYLDHSGFAVDLGDKLLIFDYYRGELPAGTSDRKLYVFSSHAHQDHFQKKIFAWSGDRDVTYILSKDIRKNAAAKNAPGEGVYYLAPRQELTLDGLSVRTLRSTDARGFLWRRREDHLPCGGSELVALGGREPGL